MMHVFSRFRKRLNAHHCYERCSGVYPRKQKKKNFWPSAGSSLQHPSDGPTGGFGGLRGAPPAPDAKVKEMSALTCKKFKLRFLQENKNSGNR